MSPPPYINPVLSGICLMDGNYAYIPSLVGQEALPAELAHGYMLSTPGSNQTYIFSVDPRFMAYEPGMASLMAPNPPSLGPVADPVADIWESRRQAVLLDLAKPHPPEQYEIRERLIQRLQTEGLNAGNAQEIGRELASIDLAIPRPPRARPAVTAEVAPMPRISEDMAREASRALGEGRPLQSVSEALPENVEVYRFDRTRKIREARPVRGAAYSSLDRALIVVDGNPGGTFAIGSMNQTQWDEFRSAAVQRGFAVTNPRSDGTLRTDARTLEYHIIADSIDDATLRYFRESHPYVRVIRYSNVDDISAGRGEVLIDSPRQYLRSELALEGTVHDVGDFVEVRNADTVLRRFPRAQVTNAFYHYDGRLTPARAVELRSVAESRGWDLSTINREQSAELLSILQNGEHRWTLPEIHDLIGSEGMRSFYNYGTEAQPFGFSSAADFQIFRTDVLNSLDAAGLPIHSGEARVILSGSAMSGFSSKGGQFRWSDSLDARGNPRGMSDYDIKVVVSREVFNQWVERSIAAQPTRRAQNALRHYIPNTDGIRWAELPPAFRDALQPLLQSHPRIQQVTIALEGGYWHVQDPMADAPHIELADRPIAPVIATASNPAARPVPDVSANAWTEVLTHPVSAVDVRAALYAADPALAEYFEREISNALSPITTMSDLLLRISAMDPAILDQAAAAATADGRPLAEMTERGIFELISRAARSCGQWNPADPIRLADMPNLFERALRTQADTSRRTGSLETREQEERRERERRIEPRGRP